jgi:hypothetical protein
MARIPTAEEFLQQSNVVGMTGLMTPLMIEFAKLHVEAALKEAMYKADEKEISSMQVNEYYREQILNSYPLEKIK